VLNGHIARANPLFAAAPAMADAVAIFQGPHHYITPAWYATKAESGKVVPTWNYVVVHAHARLELVDDEAWLHEHLEALTTQHESGRAEAWQISDAPPEYVSKLITGIVGVRLSITRLVGKWKLGQNRSEIDRRSMIEGLRREGDASASELSELTLGAATPAFTLRLRAPRRDRAVSR